MGQSRIELSGNAPATDDLEAKRQQRPRGLWRRRRFWLLLSLILLTVFHGQLLRAVVGMLIVQQRLPDQVDAILLDEGDSVLEESIERFESGYCQEILIEDGPRYRTDLLGITVPDHVVLRDRLVELGIPSDQIKLLENERDDGEWRLFRLLGRWLDDNPRASVVVLCDQLNTRRKVSLAHRLLTRDQFRRVGFHGIPHTTFNIKRWWKSREGWKNVFGASIGLISTWMLKEGQVELVTWDVDEYERKLVERSKRDNDRVRLVQ